MEARALAGTSRRRTMSAAALLVALLAALLGAWFVSGWRDVGARQRDARAAPHVTAAQRGGELAHELRAELEGLSGREARRPYFHYQNLFHDPKGTGGWSVTPSPLAGEPEERLVLGYFQLDAAGRATTPTINDDVPDLSEPRHLAENRAFRDEVVRDLASLAPPKPTAALVAKVEPKPVARPPRPAPASRPAEVIQVDPSSYAQNARPNGIYNWQRDNNNLQVANRPVPPAAPIATPAPTPVTITVSPLEWRTQVFAGAPALVAVRQVQTPDGNLAQGFVVDRAFVTSWLAARAGELVAELHAGEAAGTELVAG